MENSKNPKKLYKIALEYVKGERGEITEETKQLAFKNCIASSGMVYMPAMNLLGIFYALGYGTTKDEDKAIRCFKHCDIFDVSIYNMSALKLLDEGMWNMWKKAEATVNFETGLSKIKDIRMFNLISDMILLLEGEIKANTSNIWNLMFLTSMQTDFCFFDSNNDIIWITPDGEINQKANEVFSRYNKRVFGI